MAAAPARVCVRRGVEVRKEGVCEPPSLLPATAGHQPTSNAKPTNPGERWGGGVALLRCKQAPNVAGRRAGANRPPLVATRSNVKEAVVPPRRWAPQARASRETVGGGGTRDQQKRGGRRRVGKGEANSQQNSKAIPAPMRYGRVRAWGGEPTDDDTAGAVRGGCPEQVGEGDNDNDG